MIPGPKGQKGRQCQNELLSCKKSMSGHCQAEQIRQECERSFMNFIIRDIIFDFSDTSFMDSSGIGLILGRVRQIHPINGKVYLFGGNEIVRKMLEMSGIQNVVTVLDTIEEVKEVYE